MGAVGGGGEQKKAVKTATGKIVFRRRLGIRIDMTPMVDIVFLLLIFYMVTTVFSMPQAMEVNLPKKEEVKDVETKESHVLIIRVDEEGRFWKNIGRKIPEQISLDSLRQVLIRENQAEPKLATIVTIHKNAKYHHLVDILDEIDIVERTFRQTAPDFSYRFAMKPWDADDDRAVAKALGGTG